jgi:ABC-type Fe3+ transport system permease subunit
MKIFRNRDDDNDDLRPHYRTSYGDIGVVVIAAFCTLAFILMMVLPSPIAKWEKDKAKQEESERQLTIQKAVSSGEVSVGIQPERH